MHEVIDMSRVSCFFLTHSVECFNVLFSAFLFSEICFSCELLGSGHMILQFHVWSFYRPWYIAF